MPSFGFAIDRRHTRNDAGALGQRFLKPNRPSRRVQREIGWTSHGTRRAGLTPQSTHETPGRHAVLGQIPTTVSPEERQ